MWVGTGRIVVDRRDGCLEELGGRQFGDTVAEYQRLYDRETSVGAPQMATLHTVRTSQQKGAGGEAVTRSRVEALEGALTGALEQIAELRERVETLEAGGKTRKALGRKTS
jgi:hypothetical protein